MNYRLSAVPTIITVLLGSLLVSAVPTSGEGVSPGAPDAIAPVDRRCPTFIWEAEDQPLYYEIVAYAVPGHLSDDAVFDADLREAQEMLYTRVPGGASGWTPSVDQALVPGVRYVWFVRAVYEAIDAKVVDAGEWSRGRFFSVVERPFAEDEASQAAESNGEGTGKRKRSGVDSFDAGRLEAGPKTLGTAPKSAPTAPAAIRGEHPEPSAEAYGVVGSSASPQGAGVAAVNTAGGVDLVLDGSEDLEADARFSQGGIDRPSPVPESFTIGNSQGGGMTLMVGGDVAADSFSGDGSALTGIVADNADTLDGEHGAFYRDAGNLNAGVVATDRYSAADDLAAEGYLGDAAGDLAQNNGALQPMLNADLLDGADSAFFLDAGNLSGAMSTDRYSAYADLGAEGYLDDSADGDLLTRTQGEARFVDVSGDTVTGTLVVDGDAAQLGAKATATDETSGDVVKLGVESADGTPLFTVDSEGDLVAASLSGDGAGLTGITADDADTVDGYDAADLQPLTEGQVENYITNAPINLAASSSMGGTVISTGPHTVDTNAGTLCNPGEYLDGDGTCHTDSVDGGNAATFDGLDSTQFLRSDVDDEVDGMVTFNQQVGIGTVPTAGVPFDVSISTPGQVATGAQVHAGASATDATDVTGLRVTATGGGEFPQSNDMVGVESEVTGGHGKHYGVRALATDTSGSGWRYGVYGKASGLWESWGLYGEAAGADTSNGVQGYAHGVTYNYGVKGVAEDGQYSLGVRGFASNGSVSNYGVYGGASGVDAWGFFTPNRSYVGTDLVAGQVYLENDQLFFDGGAKSLFWNDADNRFDLNGYLQTWPVLRVGDSTNDYAWLHVGSAVFYYAGDGDRSRLTLGGAEFQVEDELMLGPVYAPYDGDRTMSFRSSGTAVWEHLWWRDSSGYFELSEELRVSAGNQYAIVGDTDYGIEGNGTEGGAWLWDSDGSGEIWLAPADAGLYAIGDNYGGYFDDTNSTSWAKVGYSSYKIQGSGTMSFVQNHPEEPDQVIVYAAPEGDEVATYTRGTAQLVDGEARVSLGETFRWVTNPDLGLTVHLTPVGGFAPLYVAEKSTSEIVVRSASGASDATFDYLVYGLRIGFEESSIVQEKQREAWIPAMTDHRELYKRRPELERYNARRRFQAMEATMGKAAPDESAAAALVEAIHEYDPASDAVHLPEVEDRLQEHAASEPRK